ncbi:MAG TPA: hypothetical protein GXX14_08120 [Clostridiaceae bacterium]|nr:hypothetical protein [Clostridiaceae bacterium]
MGYLRERVSYLRGLAEGMQISDATNEGKLLKAIIDVMDDIALAVEDVEEVQEQMGEQIETLDEDLAEVESVLFDDDYDEYDNEGCYATNVECPYCEEPMDISEDMINDENMVECPNCHKEFEIEWDCECGSKDDEIQEQ